MGVFLAVLMASAMLIIAPGLSFYFDVVPKATLILCGAAALLAASGLDGRGLWVRPRGAWALGALLVAALASLAVSTALSVRPALSLFGTNWRFFGAAPQFAVFAIAWALAVRCGGRPERVRLVLRGAAAAGALSAAYGIAQYFGYDPLLPAASYRIGEGIWAIVRPPGTLGHAGYFATWLVCACFLSVTLAAMETRRRARALSAGAAGLAAAAVFLTGARAGMLALVAGGCAWVLWRRPRLRRRALLAVCAAALAGAVFYVSPAGWMLRSRARWFSEDRWGGARLLLWRDALKMGAHAPLAGYGPEMFEAAFPRFESAELARAYPDFAYESPHNMFLDALASQGLPGALIVAGVCWLGFRAAWRLRSVRRAEAAGLAAALAGIVMSQQFTAFTLPTALAFYGAVALAVALASEGDRGADDRLSSSAGLLPPRNPGAIAGHRRRWPAPLWTFAASASAAALLWAAARLVTADHALAAADRAIRGGDYARASSSYAAHRKRRLPGAGSDMWYSRALANMAGREGNPVTRLRASAEAGAAALRAPRESEEPFNAWYNLAAFYAARNNPAGAETALRRAIAARPRWFKPHWTLARLLQLESRSAEAESEAALALRLNGDRNPEVAATLARASPEVLTHTAP